MVAKSSSLVIQFSKLAVRLTPLRPLPAPPLLSRSSLQSPLSTSWSRLFSSTPTRAGTWLLPTQPEKKRSRKGRPRVPTGGSSRGTTVVWGDYGLRMCDHHRRVSASQLKNGEDAIKQRLRGMRYRLYTRICANIGVYTSGNEVLSLPLPFADFGEMIYY
jgi:Ribosomal protein L16p/L10e